MLLTSGRRKVTLRFVPCLLSPVISSPGNFVLSHFVPILSPAQLITLLQNIITHDFRFEMNFLKYKSNKIHYDYSFTVKLVL
jgi:hypothetical protein